MTWIGPVRLDLLWTLLITGSPPVCTRRVTRLRTPDGDIRQGRVATIILVLSDVNIVWVWTEFVLAVQILVTLVSGATTLVVAGQLGLWMRLSSLCML